MVLVFFVLAAIIFIQTALVYRQFKTAEPFGLFVSLAGRQSSLSQRVELLLERLPLGREEDQRILRQTMVEIDRVVRLFDQGGEIEGLRLPPLPDYVQEAVDRQKGIWNELSPVLQDLLMMRPERIRDAASEERARFLARGLLGSSIQLVDALETWHAELTRELRDAAVTMSVLALLLITAAAVLGWVKVVGPVREAKEKLAELLPDGPLTAIPPKEVEIDSVAQLVTEVTADVDRLRSERQEVEDELRQVEADYRSIFLNAVVGILQVTQSGRIMTANPALARILRYDSLSDLLTSVGNVHEQVFFRPQHQTRLDSLPREGGSVFELETEVRCKDGDIIWVLESGSLVKTNEDGSFYYESVLVDITPRKKAQESLRELSGLLLRSQEEERRRIGRDLHDSVGQLIAALQMSLDRVGRSAKCLASEEQKMLTTCSDLAEQCSTEIRSVSHLLHPPLLEELGLRFALEEYVEGFRERSGIQVGLTISAELERLSPDAETALFRFVQEALTNVHRHAESPSADIRLELVSDALCLEVADQGRGLPPEVLDGGERRAGVGMRGMEERLRELGGELSIESGDWGTRLRAHLPYSRNILEST
jgi:PAS domain S-box-containing protein